MLTLEIPQDDTRTDEQDELITELLCLALSWGDDLTLDEVRHCLWAATEALNSAGETNH